MISEATAAAEGLSAAMGAGHAMSEQAEAHGRFTWQLHEYEDGPLISEGGFDNVVCTAGKNVALNAYLAGSAYTVTGPFLGLISATSWSPLSTTLSSGTYTTGTGAVTSTTAASHGLTAGDTFTIASATGTGSFAAIDSTFVATTGTTGTTLNFTTAPGLTMTITGGAVTTASATRIADTMASHANWLEAGGSNAPAYTGNRGTAVFGAASAGAAAITPIAFTFTSSGTIEGAFLTFGTGAVNTKDNTAGTLYSAGTFGTPQPVIATNVLTVSYSASM